MSTINESDIEQVIQQRHDESHFLVKSTEEIPGRSFPSGTRAWIVEHESKTCTHHPPCHWYGWVYWYQGRFTLLKDMEAPFVTVAELIDRITGAQQN